MMPDKNEITKMIIETLVGGGVVVTIVFKLWLKPIVDYKKLKSKIAHDLHFYADAIEVPKHDCPLRNKAIEKHKIFRENSASMTAITNSIPFWYKAWLKYNFEEPKEAISPLQYISNADYDGCSLDVAEKYKDVKKALQLE